MARISKFSLVLLALVPAWAQAPQQLITAAQARQYEQVLAANPTDRTARAALLDYYFLNSRLNAAEAIAARRRLILWLIEFAPSDPLTGGPSATIDAAGHRLADPTGFQQASAAWQARIASPETKAAALVNAAYFFKLSDKPLTIRLLERAIVMEPGNKEYAARLGDEYALTIMGITMVNKNGFPQGVDPQQAQSAASTQAREALTTSRNPYVLAKAGYMLSFQGAILRGMGQLAFDTAPLAEAALQRAVSLAPGDREVASYLAQHRAIQQQISGAARLSR